MEFSHNFEINNINFKIEIEVGYYVFNNDYLFSIINSKSMIFFSC